MSKEESGALSEREEQVLLHATRGLTDKEIARKLGISTATVLTYWMRIRNKLGGSNRAELVASAVRKDAQGEITAKQTENQLLLGEILRRMQAEENMRDSEERYRTLFNGGSDWILVFHLEDNNRPSRFVEVNDIACERLGYSREELMEMSVYELVDRTLVNPQAEIEKLAAEGRIIMESIHVTKDGMRIPTEVSATLFTFSGKPTVQSVCRDLTARKEAEHAVKDAYEAMERRVKTRTSELEEQILQRQKAAAPQLAGTNLAESVMARSRDGVITYDADLKITGWNPAMEQMTGLEKADVVGKLAAEVLPFLAEPSAAKSLTGSLKGKSSELQDREFEIPSSGKKGAFDASYSPLLDDSGKVVGGLAIIHETLAVAKAKAKGGNGARLA